MPSPKPQGQTDLPAAPARAPQPVAAAPTARSAQAPASATSAQDREAKRSGPGLTTEGNSAADPADRDGTKHQARPENTTATPLPPAPPAVTLPSTAADYLKNPPPIYPRASKRLGEQGLVLVRALINTAGRAQEVELGTSSGYPRLDQAALAAVREWRFVPGTRAGVAETMWFELPIRFVQQ